ncbi:hypothetical protein ABC502_07985 [Alkalimonas sp. NCh-2]|uniref:hypothetical protein n=1 Tax=Alkalimonas sp. NCh-2 TaxID=3144846 RepID=UPI0031F60AD3
MNLNLVEQLLKPLYERALLGSTISECFALYFNGVNAYGEFESRLITIGGINLIRFQTGFVPAETTNGTQRSVIITQHIPGVTAWDQREFHLITDPSGYIQLQAGSSSFRTSLTRLESFCLYEITVDYFSSNFRVKNVTKGTEENLALSYGSGSQPTAKTYLAGLPTGGIRFMGQFIWIEVNGNYYPMRSKGSAVQQAEPNNGNPLTLFNTVPENWGVVPCNLRP